MRIVIRASGRTDEEESPRAARAVVAAALRAANLEVCHFVRVDADGGGVMWNAWPDGVERAIPAGTFDPQAIRAALT